MHYRTTRASVEWDLDPNYLLSVSAISRMGRKNRYIVYCLVRTVERSDDGKSFSATASALLIAQPSKYVDKTPVIAYIKQSEAYDRQQALDEDDA